MGPEQAFDLDPRGPRMLDPGPSGREGEKLCLSPAAYQGPRPGWARGCPGDTEPQACAGPRPGEVGRGAGIWFPLLVWGCLAAEARRPRCRRRRPSPPAEPGQDRWGLGLQPPARRAASSFWRPPKMTICHSIKVSGQLMGEPGSATPGQNGLLPRIGEVQMLNAEHCGLSQARPPPGRGSGRWTAAG